MAAVVDHPSSSVPRSRVCAAVINGVHTDFVLTWYSNRVFVIVTQYRKFGTLVHINRDQAISRTNDDHSSADSHTFTTKVLMGSDQPIWHVYGQQICKAITGKESSKDVLLAIALQKHSPDILRCIIKQIESMKQSNVS